VGGISGVFLILHHIEVIDNTDPRKKEAYIQLGNEPVYPTKTIGNKKREI
jgi:hypothetical protein